MERLKQAEEALKENEERYRILAENVIVGVALIQDGKFVFVNKTMIGMFGFSDDKQLLGKDADKLFEGKFKRGGANFFGPFYTNETGKEYRRMGSLYDDKIQGKTGGLVSNKGYHGEKAQRD